MKRIKILLMLFSMFVVVCAMGACFWEKIPSSNQENPSNEENPLPEEEESPSPETPEGEENNTSTISHNLTYTAGVEAVKYSAGNIEYWYCEDCETYFADEDATIEISEKETIIIAPFSVVDFVVEVPAEREPVILQLSDPQSTTADLDSRENREFRYIRQVVETVKPDLILVTGDNLYGQYSDANGQGWIDYIEFMESFQTPWAPVMGNHDNECPMGADWQCDLLEAAEYCLFKQRTLKGNGNYTVAIAQGNQLQRVFFMMDSNGCSAASDATKANGHTKTSIGFANDQIEWYKGVAKTVKSVFNEIKISFAFHIQIAKFADAFAKYGFVNGDSTTYPINIDTHPNKGQGDFGYIGRSLKNAWDTDYKVWNTFKEIGVDSIFVGHEHCNSASVVYEGVRFQFGQKSSTFDRFNAINKDGEIVAAKIDSLGSSTPIMGGTVFTLSATDGTIEDAYIEYFDLEKYSQGLIEKGIQNANTNWANYSFMSLWSTDTGSFISTSDALLSLKRSDSDVGGVRDKDNKATLDASFLKRIVDAGYTHVTIAATGTNYKVWHSIVNPNYKEGDGTNAKNLFVQEASKDGETITCTIALADLLNKSTGEYVLKIGMAGWWGGCKWVLNSVTFSTVTQ